VASSLLKVDGSVVVSAAGGPLKVEYALFESGEIALGKNALGRPIEFGYSTTAGEARRRLSLLGASPDLAETYADLMRPTLTEAYARGGAVRKLVGLFETPWIFEATTYAATTGTYEGTFMDLAALAHDLARPNAQSVFQALSLALRLARCAEDAPVELETSDITSHLKTGERTFQRITLEGLSDLPALLEDLANRGGGRGFRGDPLPRARLEELLAPRLPSGAKLSTFMRALDTREVPAKGPLAKAELWEIELLLDRADVTIAAQKIDYAERAGGRTPATAYLRARHDLLARTESPTILAQRVAALALSMSSFVELGLLAGEAWLAAADGRRAHAYAKDVLDTKGIDEALRERAARVVQEAALVGNSSNTAIVAQSSPPKSPSILPSQDERIQPFFGDPRAEPDLTIDRRPAADRPSEVPGARTTKRPTLPPRSATPTGIAIPQAGPLPTLDPGPEVEERSRRETSRPPGRVSAAPSLPPSVPPSVRRPTNVGMGALAPPPDVPKAAPSMPPPSEAAIARSKHLTPAEAFRPVSVPFPSSFPAPADGFVEDDRKARESIHPALKEPPTPTLSGEFMRGATRPPSIEGSPPVGFSKAPLFPPSEPGAPELAEHLSLPAGLLGGAVSDTLPRSVLEARIQFTLLSRELGLVYRTSRNIELRADLSGIEHMQAYLFERFANRRVETPEAARDVQIHGAFLSEILSRKLAAEWVDISADQLGHWEMMVAPGTRVWPFGRVARLIAKGHKERDLVSYFLELQAKRLRPQ